jgi:hypothetical protein
MRGGSWFGLRMFGGLFAVVVLQGGVGLVDAGQESFPFGGAIAVGLLLELAGGPCRVTTGGGWGLGGRRG